MQFDRSFCIVLKELVSSAELYNLGYSMIFIVAESAKSKISFSHNMGEIKVQ